MEQVRRFECVVPGVHYKFWEPRIYSDGDGFVFEAYFGRIGTKGQTRTKFFVTRRQAEEWMQNKIREKFGKGYVEAKAVEREEAGEAIKYAFTGKTLPSFDMAMLVAKVLDKKPWYKRIVADADDEKYIFTVNEANTLGDVTANGNDRRDTLAQLIKAEPDSLLFALAKQACLIYLKTTGLNKPQPITLKFDDVAKGFHQATGQSVGSLFMNLYGNVAEMAEA